MTLEFLAAIVAAFFGAGIGLILRWIFRDRLPRWIVPVFAGLGMIAMSIYNEYTWYPRLKAGMPEGVVIAQVHESRVPWRPWTFAVPLVNEVYLVDTRRSLRNPETPDLVLTQVFRFARWQNTREIMSVFDCANARRVDLTEGVQFDEAGEMTGGTWVALDPGDPILRVACDGG